MRSECSNSVNFYKLLSFLADFFVPDWFNAYNIWTRLYKSNLYLEKLSMKWLLSTDHLHFPVVPYTHPFA